MGLRNDVKLKGLMDELAEKHGISKGEANLMWRSMGEFVENVITKENVFPEPDTYKSVYLFNFGTFYPKLPNIAKIKEKLDNESA